VDTNNTPKTQQRLKAEGWKMATITAGTNLDRILEMYRELGIQVYLEELKPGQYKGCTKCFTDSKETIYRVYTKQPGS
jgi:hypothetical protein